MNGFKHERISLAASKSGSTISNGKSIMSDDGTSEDEQTTLVKNVLKRRRVAIASSSESDDSPIIIRRKPVEPLLKSPPWVLTKSKCQKLEADNTVRIRRSSSSSEEENTESALEALMRQRKLKNIKKFDCPASSSREMSVASVVDVEDEDKDEETVKVGDDDDEEEEDCDTPPLQSAKKQARKAREKICVDFFNSASVDELESLQRVTPTHAQLIIGLRPFEDFENLYETFCETKGLPISIVDNQMHAIRLQICLDNLLQVCREYCENIECSTRQAKQPANMNEKLRLKQYQLLGLGWLKSMDKHNLNAILADEMGLGKTIQVIAFLSWLKEVGRKGPHLVCVPSSTLDNWKNELERWSPELNVMLYYGDLSERMYIRKHMKYHHDVDVLLTTYNMITSKSDDRKFFRRSHLEYSVFDEAHMLKNANTNRYHQLIRTTAKRTILLTGTPLQNNLGELISLIHFVMPKLVSEHVDQFSDLLAHFQKKDGKSIGKYEREKITLAKQILKPFYLRRVKAEILSQLPPKVEEIELCPLLDDQQEMYNAVLERIRDENDTARSMNNLMVLRKVANHPLLHRKHYDDNKVAEIAKKLYAKDKAYQTSKVEYIVDDLSFMTDLQIHQMCQKHKCIKSFSLERGLFSRSAKLLILKDILAKYKKKGDKVLVFTQFVMVLDILDVFLQDLGYSFLRLDGSTPVTERQELINEFNDDPEMFIFILSTRAGGLGINLTAANVIVLHDIDFNPYNDKQAEDRCHRLGQTKTVTVIKLIGAGTVEEGMLTCAQSKLLLEMQVTGNKDFVEEDSSETAEKLLKEALKN